MGGDGAPVWRCGCTGGGGRHAHSGSRPVGVSVLKGKCDAGVWVEGRHWAAACGSEARQGRAVTCRPEVLGI